jgi:hypothetical protein
MRHRRIGAALAALTLLASGCATPGPLLTENVGAIRSGVAAAHQQAKTSFTAANQVAREQAVERKLRLPSAILRESDFPSAVPADAAAQWDGAFDILDSYAAALQSLVDPKRAAETSSAIGALGESLNAPNINARIPGALTGVFQTLGGALVQARAERQAIAVMRVTDPAFNEVVGQMASAIGQPTEPGSLANTIWSQWQNSVLPLLETEYQSVPPTDASGRRDVIDAYLAALGQRDAQLGELMLLRQSLLALGEAHRAASNGKPGDALFWIGRINGWADEVRKSLKASEEAEK